MDILLEIIKITLPSLVLVLLVYIMLKKQNERLAKVANQNKVPQQKTGVDGGEKIKIVLPLKLQAYERITVFLERIAPSSLIMRIHKPGMSAKLLHADLLKAIREEFEHNVAQQVYISENSWELSKQAKEETIKIINLGLGNMADDASGIDLSKAIFEMMMQLERSPSNIALDYIHKEVKQLING